MNILKDKFFLVLMILFFSVANAFAVLNVNVTFDNGGPVDTAIKSNVESALYNKLAKYMNMPDLTRGFGNANTYASNAATMRGFQGYDLFSIAVGTMVSVQAPDADPEFYKDLQDELDYGDVYAGVGANPIVGQFGLNLDFLLTDLYVSFRYGMFNYRLKKSDYDVHYDSNLIGAMLNYQIISEKAILRRAILWRGISIESGYIFSKNRVDYYKDIDTITVTNGTTIATVDPSIDLEMDIKSNIVPVELYTSIRLFYILSIGAGVGFDYVVANTTDLSVRSAGDAVVVQFMGNPVNIPGKVTVDAGTDGKADKFRSKAMANVAVGIGPVFIDVPLTFYFDNGYAAGVSVGMAW